MIKFFSWVFSNSPSQDDLAIRNLRTKYLQGEYGHDYRYWH
jgi:hypothetical protein